MQVMSDCTIQCIDESEDVSDPIPFHLCDYSQTIFDSVKRGFNNCCKFIVNLNDIILLITRNL